MDLANEEEIKTNNKLIITGESIEIDESSLKYDTRASYNKSSKYKYKY